jgi:hypothetical protein
VARLAWPAPNADGSLGALRRRLSPGLPLSLALPGSDPAVEKPVDVEWRQIHARSRASGRRACHPTGANLRCPAATRRIAAHRSSVRRCVRAPCATSECEPQSCEKVTRTRSLALM